MNTTTSEVPKETGSIPALIDVLTRGRRIADRLAPSPGEVRVWFGSVRVHLRKIFGSDSKVFSLWPAPDAQLRKDDALPAILKRLAQLEQLVSSLNEVGEATLSPTHGNRVFIGHGRSLVWRELKDFLVDRLALPWEEFNRESVAGISTSDRLNQMLDATNFALLIMTAEDEHANATLHARENVVHEIWLFQGRLGLRRAIVLLENGCQPFSNIHGLTPIPFPRGRISASFEEIRGVLDRECIVGT